MQTNLNTLKAKVRGILRSSMLPNPAKPEDMENAKLKYVAEDGKEFLFLASGFVDDIAHEMQRLEMEAVQRYTAQSRSIPNNPAHDPRTA